MDTYEHIIIATDGNVSYKIEFIKRQDVEKITFQASQNFLRRGCRLVELNSYREVKQFASDGFRNGFPSDESNWDFFSKKDKNGKS